jgi:hypothetical protein
MFDYLKQQQSEVALAFCTECRGWANATIGSDGRIVHEPAHGDRTYFTPSDQNEVMAAAQAFWNEENMWVHITYHGGTYRVTMQEPDADDPKFEILGHHLGSDLAQAIMETCVEAKRKLKEGL